METLAERLKSALSKADLSQADLARRVGVSRGAVSLWISGSTKELSSDNLLAAARALGVTPEWLASGRQAGSTGASAGLDAPTPVSLDGGDVVVWEHPDDLPPDETRVWVDRWDYSCSAGNGTIQWEIRQKKALPFTGDFFRAKGCKPDVCKLVTVRGDSMEPFLFDRDMMMIDTSKIEPRDGGVYAVVFEGEALVKQVFKESGGALVLHSYNPKYRDKRIEPSAHTDFKIVGEVIYRSGGGFSS